MPKKLEKLTLEQWAILCTIKQEPKYRFLGNEFKAASTLESHGVLQPIGNRMFSITKFGIELYNKSLEKPE